VAGTGAGGLIGTPAHGLAGGQQLASGSLGERLEAHRGQHPVGRPQLFAGVNAAVLTAQPLAVQQVGASEFGAQPGPA
jgi:hypothetical protein